MFTETILPMPYKGRETSPYPVLVQIDDNLWMLAIAFSYTAKDGWRYTAPAGMPTDMASIPRPLWAILPPNGGLYSGAALIHDYLYQYQITTKERADDVLYEAMIAAGVPFFEAQVIYKGVRVGGQSAWDGHTAELKLKREQP